MERLLRDVHASPSLALSPVPAGSNQLSQTPVYRSPEQDRTPRLDRMVLTLNLDVGLNAATDKILQWPIFGKLLSSLRRYRFVDYRGFKAYTYLDDFLNQSDETLSRLLVGSPRHSSSAVNILTERADIQTLVDKFFDQVNIKNPILGPQVAKQYCQQYYEHGPLFNLETCLVLLTCALGAISMEFDPHDVGHDPGSPSQPDARLSSLRLGHCYFVAAEKRLGAAMSHGSTLAIQCLCLAGFVSDESYPGIIRY